MKKTILTIMALITVSTVSFAETMEQSLRKDVAETEGSSMRYNNQKLSDCEKKDEPVSCKRGWLRMDKMLQEERNTIKNR